jgi:hypothetical protein
MASDYYPRILLTHVKWELHQFFGDSSSSRGRGCLPLV